MVNLKNGEELFFLYFLLGYSRNQLMFLFLLVNLEQQFEEQHTSIILIK